MHYYKLFGISSESIMEQHAQWARFVLLVRHALTTGSIIGVLAMLLKTGKGGHKAGAPTASTLGRWVLVLLGVVHDVEGCGKRLGDG